VITKRKKKRGIMAAARIALMPYCVWSKGKKISKNIS
jgi:hypothetical protein